MLTLRLALAHLRRHPTRALLTIAAIAISVSLIVAMAGGLRVLRDATYRGLDTAFGAIDVAVTPVGRNGSIGPETVQLLSADPRVHTTRLRLEVRAIPVGSDDKPLFEWPLPVVGVRRADRNADTDPPLKSGRWFEDAAEAEVVLSDEVAQKMNVGIGDQFALPRLDGDPLELTVVGILQKPDILWMSAPRLYLPLTVLQNWAGRPGHVNKIEIDLIPGADPEIYTADLQRKTDADTLRFKTVASQRDRFEQAFAGLDLAAAMAGGVITMTAVFIVFTTLSMGVSERARILGMLRAIGATRRRIAGLVLIEAWCLGLAGGLIGLAIGSMWLMLAQWWKPNLFDFTGYAALAGTGWGLGAALGTVTGAAALPAWAATRTRPIEAITAAGRTTSPRILWGCGATGLLLLALDPLFAFWPDLEPAVRLQCHLWIGLAALPLGLALIAPLLVRAISPLLGHIAAICLRVPHALLSQQIGGNVWRSAGTAAALMVGPLCMTAVQVHGRSMIGSLALPTRFPDMVMMSLSPFGLDPKDVLAVEAVEGVAPDSVLPIVVLRPELGQSVWKLFSVLPTPESTALFAVDVDRALGQSGRPPMIEFDFIEGDAAGAAAKLRTGRHAIVTEAFKEQKGLKLGDKVPVKTPKNGEVAYTIAGIVRAPGADLVARLYDMEGEFETWTTTSILTTIDDVERDFGPQRIFLFLFDVEATRDRKLIENEVRHRLKSFGVLSADARHLKSMLDRIMGRLLETISTLALGALLIAAFGVANTVAASVRARRWQLGVMRSQGLSRSMLIRLIAAEGLLLGALAALMGIGGGLMLGLDANGLATRVLGQRVPTVIPISPLLVAAGATVTVALLASLWPAIRTARTVVLTLLTADRSDV